MINATIGGFLPEITGHMECQQSERICRPQGFGKWMIAKTMGTNQMLMVWSTRLSSVDMVFMKKISSVREQKKRSETFSRMWESK
ncbi:hypothetical protein ScPMuIL_017212 [Solemya velum]